MTLDPRQKVRRKRALISYCVILIELLLMIPFVVYGSEDMRENLLVGMGIITPVNLCLVGLIGQYHHHAQQTDHK